MEWSTTLGGGYSAPRNPVVVEFLFSYLEPGVPLIRQVLVPQQPFCPQPHLHIIPPAPLPSQWLKVSLLPSSLPHLATQILLPPPPSSTSMSFSSVTSFSITVSFVRVSHSSSLSSSKQCQNVSLSSINLSYTLRNNSPTISATTQPLWAPKQSAISWSTNSTVSGVSKLPQF